MNDERFEDLLQEMRDESVPPDRLEATKRRVWERLRESSSLACEELRPAFDDYARGTLGEARRLLIEDHLSRCVECRQDGRSFGRGTGGRADGGTFGLCGCRRRFRWFVFGQVVVTRSGWAVVRQ